METTSTFTLAMRRAGAYFKKPWNVVLLVVGVALTITTVSAMSAIVLDTVTVHPGQSDDPTGAGANCALFSTSTSCYTLLNWKNLFAPAMGKLLEVNFLTPLLNSVLLAAFACLVALVYGGIFAYLVTRTDMPCRKWLSAIFIFPYVMPQWTLAVVWRNLFNSAEVTGGSDGLLASVFGLRMPLWWCQGLFPSSLVLGLHYSAFAYIFIGAIFRNMDANLEEAATILNTPRWKTFLRITLPMIKPAIYSTTLLVFSSAMGSYPVPHYLKLSTLTTQYVSMNVAKAGQASILAVTMMLFGIALMVGNQLTTSGRKSYTTVSGKSGQISKIQLGSVGRWVIAGVFLVLTLFTSIYPIIAFAFETFLPNPGDYSFLRTGDPDDLTTKWWTTSDTNDSSLFGQPGILFNPTIWGGVRGQLIVAVGAALIAGTIGLLIGYCVAKNRRSKWANFVNNMAFLPYLMPALAVGVAFFIFGSSLGLFNTFALLIITGTIKYIPFASRAALNSMLQLSNEIEESAMIQGIPWWKRMVRIIIPIQKTSIISGYMLPFMTCLRELTLFMLLCSQTKIITLELDYFDEMGLYAYSSAINLILIVIILVCNTAVNKLTGASIDKGLGG
ncbi:MAG: iron ABC transporter permease [Propionibacteriaceae bacterium]|jgi:iron(III) transport system permease protein|nr:iron ABC transporter permease [Propionibacteriaceae bacterium]